MTRKRTPFRPPQTRAEGAGDHSGWSAQARPGTGVPDDIGRKPRQGAALAHGKPETQYQSDFPGRGSRQKTAADGHGNAHPTRGPLPPTEKLHKVLARAGLGSRRDMEAAIVAGRVSVNGHPAELGARVAATDRVLVDGRPVHKPRPDELPRILLYHKPEGEIVSHDDPQGRESVFDKLPRVRGGKWISIGRLDYNTSGLLIFTTSGDLVNRLSHPRFEVEREYAVRVMGALTREQCEQLCKGVELDDGAAKFEWLREEGGEASNHWYRVMLKEGRNREVRRMFEAMNVMVSRLMRVRYGIINLPPRLKRGEMLQLEEKQVRDVLTWAGMKPAGADSAGAAAPKQNKKERRPLPRNPRAGISTQRVRRSR